MPLANKSYQVVTAQTVDNLLFIPQVCTDLGMDFLRQECNKKNIQINDVALDDFIGGQILGLIGISNLRLQPQLEYLSPSGLGLYQVPLKGVTQFGIGGNYPSVQFMRNQMKQNFVPEMLCQAERYTTPPRPD